MWAMLLPYWLDGYTVTLLSGLVLAVGICVIAKRLLDLIPPKEAKRTPYHHIQLAVFLAAVTLVLVVLVILVVAFVPRALGSLPPTPAPMSLVVKPEAREEQARRSNQRYGEDKGGDSEYGVVVHTAADIRCHRSDEHNHQEGIKYPFQPMELFPVAVCGGVRGPPRRFGVSGRLPAFAGDGGVLHFGGCHSRTIL